MVSFCTPDELTLPSFSQHFSENGGLQACHYDMSRAGRSTSGFQILYPQVSSCRPEPEVRPASDYWIQRADLQLRFAAINPSLDLVVPRPKRVAKLQSFIEATQDPTADVFKGYPTSTDHCPLSNMTGMDYSSAKFGGSSHLPAISTSTSFAPPLPRRPPTHSAALWNPPQARTNWTIPIDVSDPFVPEYFPAGSATQTSGTPPDMRSASPRGSLFDSPSFGTRLAADDSHYGAMPAESSWGPRHTRVDTVKHMPIAMSHRELAQLLCDSDRPATSTSTPPPPYGWIDRRSGADVYSPIGSPAADRYSSTNTLGRLPSLAQPNPFASFAGGGESSRDESWLQGIELRSTSTDPYAQSQERPVSHANIEIDFNDFTQSGESRHPSRDRYTQNKPWLWDKITTGASCARRYIMGKLPKHRWP
jgi:hypothetical protein